MCCSGDSTVKSTEQAQAAFTNTLTSSFNKAFAGQQEILDAVKNRLTDAIANPQGFDPKTLALMKTSASDTVAANTAAAQTAANAYLASHGGATLGTGVGAQIKGQIAGQGATEGAREESNIDIQSGLLKDENYWRAISGLTNVAQAENPVGMAGAETSSAGQVGELSKAYTQSKVAGMQAFGGLLSGIAGLGTAAVGGYTALKPTFAGAKPQ